LQELVGTRGPRAERPVIKDIIWGSRFLVRHGVADRFHAGRIALAGDAAHHNSPLGGQGMNAGIGDAVAAAGALDASLEYGSPDPLEAYTAARRPVAEQVVATTNRLTWLATMDRQVRALRSTVLARLDPIASRRLARRLSMLVYR
jgi:2-polyprenyl-6-methoxyphenol hydroxylase-like FAD-dependent oxidoreductase